MTDSAAAAAAAAAAATHPKGVSGKSYPPISVCVGYGIGTSGVSIMLNTVSVYFPTLMATVLGMSPVIAGTLLMLSKVYDAFADVVIGFASDRMNLRHGRRPFLLAGAVISFLSLLMIFLAPPMSQPVLVLYMGAALVVYSTGYSLFNVPYLAIPAEITRSGRERLRLISFRTAFIGGGQLIALALSAWLIALGGGGASGYRTMGFVMATLACVAMLASYFGIARARVDRFGGATHRLSRADFRTLLENRPLCVLLGAKLCQYVAFGVLMPVTLLFLLNVMKVGYVGMIHLSVVQNATIFLAMPAWNRIGGAIGKRKAYLLAQLIMIPVVFSWYWTDASTGFPGIWWRGLVFGFASGGALLMSTSMLPDTIEYDRLRNGLERGGVCSSLYSVNEKLGFALGALLLGLGLDLGGYVATTGGQIITQSAETVAALYHIKTLVPAAMLMIGAVVLLFYNLDEEQLGALRAKTRRG
jgi:glycoside/pentoside/hexuronide:cation symporter, GPH family